MNKNLWIYILIGVVAILIIWYIVTPASTVIPPVVVDKDGDGTGGTGGGGTGGGTGTGGTGGGGTGGSTTIQQGDKIKSVGTNVTYKTKSPSVINTLSSYSNGEIIGIYVSQSGGYTTVADWKTTKPGYLLTATSKYIKA